MQVELLPENQLAWELYWTSRLPGQVGRLIFDLHTLRMTEEDANNLAFRIQFLAGVVSEIEEEKRKAAESTHA